MDVRARITLLARELGFPMVRFTRAGPTPDAPHFEAWLEAGHHADMAWLPRTAEVRCDPRIRMKDAQTVVALGMPHGGLRPPDPGGRTGKVARYAWGRDYHNLIGKRLKKLRRALREEGIQSFGGVDTAPVLERAWAAATGLGVLGKNCMLFLPGETSWLFLAVLVVDAPCEPDPPQLRDACGRCVRCLVACPTQAFVGPRQLDARRCISYWTIESKALAPEPLRRGFGRWVFGCDVCQEVCPHNHHPPTPAETDFAPRHAWLDLDWVLSTDDDLLMEAFLGTPLRRPGAAGLKRNALVVLGNTRAVEAVPLIERVAREHGSGVVKEAAAWALSEIYSESESDSGS